MRNLTEAEQISLSQKYTCPFCNGQTFTFGPRAGLSVNIFCANAQCRAAFNLSVMVLPGFGQLIRERIT